MAQNAYVIVEGSVTRRENRSGSKQQPDGSFRDWSMDVITVLVEQTGTTELILPRNLSQIDGLSPERGDEVKFLCEVVGSARGFNVNIIRNAEAGKPSFPSLVGAE